MKIKRIKTEKPFNSIFDVDQNVLEAVKEHMEEYGYDPAAPIIIWENTVIDGHTRLEAAKQIDLEDIPVQEKEFDSEEQALQYAIHNQRDRRNLTQRELLRCIEVLDRRKESRGGGDRKSEEYQKSNFWNQKNDSKPTHQQTAKTLGVGNSTISNARTILDSDNEETKQKVESGEWSIDKGAKETREEKKIIKESTKTSTFNQVNENIEWAKWSWNPVTGCKHGCVYCYARDIANRFYEEKFEPTFRKERLPAPANTKIPKTKENEPGIKNVFVSSMGDLFGDWVNKAWIRRVLKSIEENPQWNYLFLTKNPKRYLEFDFPDHCWLGATADTQERMDNAIEVFSEKEHPVKFVSCEPLMERIDIYKPKAIQWLIIGGRTKNTKMAAGQPEWEWVEHLLFQAREDEISVYFKPNLTVVPKEYPEI